MYRFYLKKFGGVSAQNVAHRFKEYGQLTSCGCFTLDDLNKIYEDEEDKHIKICPDFERSERLLAAYKIAKNYKFSNDKTNRVPKLPVQYSLI